MLSNQSCVYMCEQRDRSKYSDKHFDQFTSSADRQGTEAGIDATHETDVKVGGNLSAPKLVNAATAFKQTSVFDFSPEYRAWRDKNTVVGIKYYGRRGAYDGPRLTKLADFLDACKVPIITFVSIFFMGFTTQSLPMVGIGALGISLFTLVFLLLQLLKLLHLV
jgi:hypothetical protein